MTTSTEAPLTSGYYPRSEGRHSTYDSARPNAPCTNEAAPLEVRVLHEAREGCPTYEIWTARTVYEFDRELRCTAVRDPNTGKAKEHHECLGARMIGGRRFQNQHLDVSFPTPAIGHNAILGGDDQPLIVTTPVTRVIMNLQRLSSQSKALDATHSNSRAKAARHSDGRT